MFKFSTVKSHGFSFVELMIGIGILSGSALLLLSLSRQSAVSTVELKNKIQRTTMNDYLIARLSYSKTCYDSLLLSNQQFLNLKNNKTEKVVVLDSENKAMGDNQEYRFLNTVVESIIIENVKISKASYGFNFYSGNISSYIMGSNKKIKTNLGIINLLEDNTGKFISCSMFEDLQSNALFVAARPH